MNYLKKRLQIVLDDSYLTITCIISFICIGLHLYQFIDSNYRIEPLCHLIFSIGFSPVIFIFGRKGSYWYWWLWANLLAVNTEFQNYTAFVIICIFIALNSKMKIPSLVLYACEIVFVATVRHKTPVHIAIHVANCICIYYAIKYLLKPTVLRNKLDLTSDEIYILEELLNGKQQKEIDLFSQNTVTNKLKQAKERNGIATTDELLKRYKEMKD